ncbi:hypothetical protein BT63DRAFT_439158 [Microthyrium microscopicum]|uniref:Uncharacterized protein n=1 Tax=Microthyrium microscopicum TaxID=703497 RepID=A0A6A6UG01_9PEZI|nr:hypothetical protein BT63DRAFT_439158 [Microthyrium microscopicum]
MQLSAILLGLIAATATASPVAAPVAEPKPQVTFSGPLGSISFGGNGNNNGYRGTPTGSGPLGIAGGIASGIASGITDALTGGIFRGGDNRQDPRPQPYYDDRGRPWDDRDYRNPPPAPRNGDRDYRNNAPPPPRNSGW